MNNENTVAVVTATYNRANLLTNLYESLLNQTSKDFIWIIIDDGSTDNTKDLIKYFILENKINIIYKFYENSGKHRAINKAIDICNSKLFFIVDSDDILTNNSIEKIIEFEKTIKNEEKYCGIAGLKADYKGDLVIKEFLYECLDATSLEATYKYKLFGDKAEVFYTNILKENKFPEIEGEKFITENVLWHKIAAMGYKIRWFNEIIYLCEYREDGLTKNALKNVVKNCKGETFYHNQELLFNIPIKYKFKHQINYFRFGLFTNFGIVELVNNCNLKYLIPLTLPMGVLANMYTRYKLRSR